MNAQRDSVHRVKTGREDYRGAAGQADCFRVDVRLSCDDGYCRVAAPASRGSGFWPPSFGNSDDGFPGGSGRVKICQSQMGGEEAFIGDHRYSGIFLLSSLFFVVFYRADCDFKSA